MIELRFISPKFVFSAKVSYIGIWRPTTDQLSRSNRCNFYGASTASLALPCDLLHESISPTLAGIYLNYYNCVSRLEATNLMCMPDQLNNVA